MHKVQVKLVHAVRENIVYMSENHRTNGRACRDLVLSPSRYRVNIHIFLPDND